MDDPQLSPISKPSKHHLIPVAITVVTLILIVMIGVYTVLTYRQNPTENSQQLAQQQTTKDTSFPRITVESWKIEKSAEMKSIPTSGNLYNFNTKYGRTEFNNVLLHFFTPTNTNESTQSLRAYSDQSGSSMFYMQKDTGSLLYKSTSGLPIASGSAAVDQSRRIVAFAQDTLRDDTLASFATYQRNSSPGVTYYELHRDWNRLGFPLYNLFGVLNLKDTPLASLSLTNSTNMVAQDKDIIKTSDNTNGLKRPNDFNTVTVGVKDGRVVTFISNLRLFPASGAPKTDKLITYDEAVKRLTNNQYSRLYTSPAGEGAVDREKLYPQNKATIVQANVTETAIAYLEELPGTEQPVLAPYYIFRGNGTLSNGYRVTFVATVPASASNVLGVSTIAQNGVDSSQKQGTLEFDEGPFPSATTAPTDAPAQQQAPTEQKTQAVPQPTSTPRATVQLPPVSKQCPEDPQSVSQLYNTQVEDGTGITYGQYDVKPPANRQQAATITAWYGPQWFAVYQGNHDVNQLDYVITLAVQRFGLTQDSSGAGSGPTTVRDFDSLLNDWESAEAVCPVRLTGRSPSVFIYTGKPQQVTVKLAGGITYADPPAPQNTWTVTTPSDYLYYEYARTEFNTPKGGWIVKKSALSSFSTSISNTLALTEPESARLLNELKNASLDVNADAFFIGLIPEAELNQKLPLTIVPAPATVHRIHFKISKAGAEPVKTPSLAPLSRSSYTVVELGATD